MCCVVSPILNTHCNLLYCSFLLVYKDGLICRKFLLSLSFFFFFFWLRFLTPRWLHHLWWSRMQNKLLSGSHKDHEKRRGCRFWIKRIKGLTGSHKARAREKGCSLCTLLTIILLTALIWSYEPHLATLLSPQEQFGLPIPGFCKYNVHYYLLFGHFFRIISELSD